MNRLLNLGCGSRYRTGWIDVDLTLGESGVMGHDLSRDGMMYEPDFRFCEGSTP